MTRRNKIKLAIFIAVDALLVGFSLWMMARPEFHFGNFAVLNPKGIIALKERGLMFTSVLLMLFAVVPAYFLLFYFSKKYSAKNNSQNKYSPNLESNLIGALIWVVPSVVIFIIAGIIWKSTHDLDPYKPIESNIRPLTIQVVALRWKWLFIYPEQNIATVNFIEFPKDTPINFELTSDGPMSTFWIPQLSGQTYAMAAMSTKLHLMANDTGEFNGLSSEINGQGYSGMRFVAKATSQNDFEAWVESIKKSPDILNEDQYNELEKPSENNPRAYYSMVEESLYNNIMMKYMIPDKAK